jgi:phosphate:Na+ symporter
MDQIDIWELLAGLGIFLFGILLLEESIKNLSGRAFKSFIRRSTEGRLRSVLSGMASTAILQSSSAVTLMVLAFAGAGLMTMANAVGVILGSNIGTTLTSWIVATVGFKVNIEVLALPFVGMGGLGLIFFGKSTKATNVSKLLVGFGFLFMGLDYMKSSIDDFAAGFDLASLPNWGPWVYLLIGIVLTAIVQSSSASMAIILSGVNSGIIGFHEASAMVIGTNMGTTVTVMLGALHGESIKKRIAFSHLGFNTFTGILTFLLLPWLVQFIGTTLGFANDPVIGLAFFHTVFNVLGVALFFPFIPQYAGFMERLVKEVKDPINRFINPSLSDVPEAGIEAFRNETLYLVSLVEEHNLRHLQIDPKLVLGKASPNTKPLPLSQLYQLVKDIQTSLFSFASQIQAHTLTDTEARELNRGLHAVRSVVASAKTVKDIQHDLTELEQSESGFVADQYEAFRKKTITLYLILEEIKQEKNNEINVPKLHKIIKQLQTDEDAFVTILTSGINTKKVKENEISGLLSANRNLTFSGRQLITSLRDLLLTEKESGIVENLENIDRQIQPEEPVK